MNDGEGVGSVPTVTSAQAPLELVATECAEPEEAAPEGAELEGAAPEEFAPGGAEAEVAAPVEAVPFENILSVLERRTEINALPALISAIKTAPHSAVLAQAAIVIDANAVLRIPGHKKSSDIIDYLSSVHKKPVVLPGQVVQEFWNNQLSAVTTLYKSIRNKSADLDKEIAKAAEAGVSGMQGIEIAVDEFKKDNEHLFDADLVQKTTSLLENLVLTARVPHAPRIGLYEIALQRKLAKTPPGFKDDGDGDFLVWVDALWGLSQAKSNGENFDHVILLTNDKKIDWCRGHTAHPILYAEMNTLLNVHLEVWTLDHFAQSI